MRNINSYIINKPFIFLILIPIFVKMNDNTNSPNDDNNIRNLKKMKKSMMLTKKKDNARKKVFKFICTENENSIDKTNRKIESKQI